MWIVIENGEVFEGTMEQFRDCFFSNADIDSIREFCASHGWSVRITETCAAEPLFPESEYPESLPVLALLEEVFKTGFVEGDPQVEESELEAVMHEAWLQYAKRMGWMK